MADETPKKHPCPDCTFCQWCSDDRCRRCLNHPGCCRRKKLSIPEQIAIYNSLNPASSPPEDRNG